MALAEERRNVFLVRTYFVGKPPNDCGWATAFLLPTSYHHGHTKFRVLVTTHHAVHNLQYDGETLIVDRVEVVDVAGRSYPVESKLQHGVGEQFRPTGVVTFLSNQGRKPADLAVLFIRDDSTADFKLLPQGLKLCNTLKTSKEVGQVHMWDISPSDPKSRELETGYVLGDPSREEMDYQVKIFAKDGNSGSPIIDHDGDVIGVHRANNQHESGRDFKLEVIMLVKMNGSFSKWDFLGAAVRADLVDVFVKNCIEQMIDANTGYPKVALNLLHRRIKG